MHESAAPKAARKKIALIGIGRAGAGIADRIKREFAFPELNIIAADTDQETLDSISADQKLCLGEQWAMGEGCGGDRKLGERATAASSDALRDLVGHSKMVFVVSGLGGGIGSAAPVLLARLGRECAVPVFFTVTMPFSFEGVKRKRAAERALELLREETDAIMVVPNSLLFGKLSPDTPSKRAFSLASDLMAKSMAGFARICCADGLLTADLAGVKRIVRRPGSTCALATGNSSGNSEDPAREAVENLMRSPFVGGEHTLRNVDAALITVLGGDDLPIRTMQQCLENVQTHLPKDATVLVGAYADSRMNDNIQITGLFVRNKKAVRDDPKDDTVREDPTPRQDDLDQDMLPFPEQQLGIFAGSPQPTYRNGENLDVPTFQRRNKRIDAGTTI